MKNENYYRSDAKSNENSKIHSSFFIFHSSFNFLYQSVRLYTPSHFCLV